MLHVVEDDPCLLEIFRRVITPNFPESCFHSHWDTCEPKPGDFVLHDHDGVGKKKVIDGVKYALMSGNPLNNPDIDKPFSVKELMAFLTTKGAI